MDEQQVKDAIDKAIQASEERTQAAMQAALAGYKKADSAWQKCRRDHPLAVQNIILFAITPVVGLICFLAGRYYR